MNENDLRAERDEARKALREREAECTELKRDCDELRAKLECARKLYRATTDERNELLAQVDKQREWKNRAEFAEAELDKLKVARRS